MESLHHSFPPSAFGFPLSALPYPLCWEFDRCAGVPTSGTKLQWLQSLGINRIANEPHTDLVLG